jgi:hypothetical protein
MGRQDRIVLQRGMGRTWNHRILHHPEDFQTLREIPVFRGELLRRQGRLLLVQKLHHLRGDRGFELLFGQVGIEQYIAIGNARLPGVVVDMDDDRTAAVARMTHAEFSFAHRQALAVHDRPVAACLQLRDVLVQGRVADKADALDVHAAQCGQRVRTFEFRAVVQHGDRKPPGVANEAEFQPLHVLFQAGQGDSRAADEAGGLHGDRPLRHDVCGQ